MTKHLFILFLSIILIVFFSYQFVNYYLDASKAKVTTEKIGKGYTEGEEKAFEIYKEWNHSIAQITILLFGAIWGFVLSQKIIFITKKNWTLWVAFLIPNLCFTFEHILYTKARERFGEMFYQWEIIDMGNYNYLYKFPDAQISFFLFGILTSLSFILLILYLKGRGLIDLYRE